MLLHIVSVCPMFRRCRSLKRYIAMSSFFAQYAQYLYNVSKYIGGKAALELGGNGHSSPWPSLSPPSLSQATGRRSRAPSESIARCILFAIFECGFDEMRGDIVSPQRHEPPRLDSLDVHICERKIGRQPHQGHQQTTAVCLRGEGGR